MNLAAWKGMKQKRMKKPWWLGLALCLYTELSYGQAWTKTDSLWLAGVLAGKDTIRLNPEFQRSIRNGTFLRLDEAAGTMRMAPSALPIGRNFSEYLRPDKDSTSHRKVALKDLPPAVFKRYGLDKPLPFSGIYKNAYTPYTPYTGPIQTGIGTSFNDGLMYVFSRNARQKARNRKYATAWKTYNDLPTPQVYRKQKQFREAHPELILRPDTGRLERDTTHLKRDTARLQPNESRLDRDTVGWKPDTLRFNGNIIEGIRDSSRLSRDTAYWDSDTLSLGILLRKNGVSLDHTDVCLFDLILSDTFSALTRCPIH